MGLFNSIRTAFLGGMGMGPGPIAEERVLDVPSGDNYRELGGYPTPSGATSFRRFIRAGSTERLTERDLERLEDYGVRAVLDLRSPFESPNMSCRFARRPQVGWLNVPLFDYDLSDPNLVANQVPEGNYLIDGYVTMLSNRAALKRIFEFFAQTAPDGGVLFHCAAGMDRTGMVAMLLLGLAGVDHKHIVADYLYSFAPAREVDEVVFGGKAPRYAPGSWNPLPSRMEAIEYALHGVEEGYGSVRAYLEACGIESVCLEAVRGMLVGSELERAAEDFGRVKCVPKAPCVCAGLARPVRTDTDESEI